MSTCQRTSRRDEFTSARVLWGVSFLVLVPEVEEPHPTALNVPLQCLFAAMTSPDIVQELKVWKMLLPDK